MLNGTNLSPNKRPLLKPAAPVPFDVGRRIHPVEDEIFAAAGPKLRQQFAEMCGPTFEMCVIRAEGKGAFCPHSDFQPPVPTEPREWLRDLVVAANEGANFNGFWAGAWNDADTGAGGFTLLWLDQDGDPHTTNEDNRAFSRLFPIDDYVTGCDAAVREWARRVGRLELAKWQIRRTC